MLSPEDFRQMCAAAAELCGPEWSVSRADPGGVLSSGSDARCVFAKNAPEARVSAALVDSTPDKLGRYTVSISVAALQRGAHKLVRTHDIGPDVTQGTCELVGKATAQNMAAFVSGLVARLAPIAAELYPAQLAVLEELSVRVDRTQAAASALVGWGFSPVDTPFRSDLELSAEYELELSGGRRIRVNLRDPYDRAPGWLAEPIASVRVDVSEHELAGAIASVIAMESGGFGRGP